jgi:CheY-like chemotaxis protein
MNKNNYSTWRVLAVDDEPDNLNLLGDVLEFQGATVKRTENAQQALTALDEFKPNMILVDLSMPGMDGWEMHRRLRSRDDLGNVPIIAISALAMQADLERAKTEGFDGYITKPFRVQALLSQLQDSLELFAHPKDGNGNGSQPA